MLPSFFCLLLHVEDLQQLKWWFELRIFLQISFSYQNKSFSG